MRKRVKLAKNVGQMFMSSISTFTVDTSNDPLSNAPVLDDGPIWNKGPKRYRFQENRRINQKLTFGVLLAVVLAIGLGLGNLVAYNECESEYKTTQVNSKSDDEASITAEIKDELPTASQTTKVESDLNAKETPALIETIPNEKLSNTPSKQSLDQEKTKDSKVIKEEPKVDPRYALHMETLSKIVKTLDNLQRKIDKFENTSRQLGGVIMLKDAEEEAEEEKPEAVSPSTTLHSDKENESASSLYDEEVHEDFATVSDNDDDDELEEEEENLVNEEDDVLDLIDGIEETIDYLRRQDEIKFAKKYDESRNSLFKSKLFSRTTPVTEEEKQFMFLVKASIEAASVAREEFIRKERDELREKKILGLAEERNPEDYTIEERAEIKTRYDNFLTEYPMNEEIDKIKNRLKREENGQLEEEENLDENDSPTDDLIEEFFGNLDSARSFKSDDTDDKDDEWNRNYDDYNVEGKKTDNLKWQSTTTEEHTEIQVEPKKSLIETKQEEHYEQSIMDFEPITMGKSIPIKDDFPKGDEDDDEEVKNKRFKRSKSHTKDYTKTNNKPERLSKTRDDFEGSGQKPPKKDNYEKKYSSNNNKKKKHQKDDDNDKENNNHHKNKKFNNKQTANKDYQNDYDFDDDDDHKRKRYSSRENKDQFPNRKHQNKEQDTNWLLERTKAREEIRRDSGNIPELNQHHSSGKKAKNWQMERDKVREKFRNKNHKNKSYDD